MKGPRTWQYGPPPAEGDGRKLVSLEEDGMVWVGIRFWNARLLQWYNGQTLEHAHVLGWIDLPSPTNPEVMDAGLYWPGKSS